MAGTVGAERVAELRPHFLPARHDFLSGVEERVLAVGDAVKKMGRSVCQHAARTVQAHSSGLMSAKTESRFSNDSKTCIASPFISFDDSNFFQAEHKSRNCCRCVSKRISA